MVPSDFVSHPFPEGWYKCPCCGFKTLSKRGGYGICPVCFWEDDGQDDPDADLVYGGPNNALSLTEARRNFVAFGASDQRLKSFVRSPTEEERQDYADLDRQLIEGAKLPDKYGTTTVLYRPVGQAELDLIAAREYREFPPRLHGQPIFYPVLTESYAEQIARDWNTKEPSGVGYVTSFAVDSVFLERYEVKQVGNKDHVELWVPAEDLPEFNEHIVGKIHVIAEFRALR